METKLWLKKEAKVLRSLDFLQIPKKTLFYGN